jgi:hypothetical protein
MVTPRPSPSRAVDRDRHISHSCSLCMRADHFPGRFAPVYGCGKHTKPTPEADVTATSGQRHRHHNEMCDRAVARPSSAALCPAP